MAEIIAIVDDTEGTRYALRRTLERAGFSVVEGASGADALRLAAQNPALMVLDVHLPDVMGPEVTRQLKSDAATRSIPVLHLSASYTTEIDRAAGLNCGADAYLTEPVETPLLLATIHALLRSRAAQQLAERAARLRDDVLLVTAHDVRGVLHAVRLSLEAQLRRTQEREVDRPALTRSLERLVRELGGMTRLLQDLLESARMDAEHRGLHTAPADLAALAEEAMQRSQADATASGSTLSLDAPAPVRGRFDAPRVSQVVENLLSNAIKYGEGKPISVSVRADGAFAEISVADQGRGIPVAEQARIFERFERGGEEVRPGSYGLGLWIAREIVRLHRGTLSVESEVGKGSVFTVRLPLSAPE